MKENEYHNTDIASCSYNACPLYSIGETLIDYDGTQIIILDLKDKNYKYKIIDTQEIKYAPFRDIDFYYCAAISYKKMHPLIDKLKSMEAI